MNKRNINIEENDKPPPLIINIMINLFVTFALTLSIYLLIANVFLTVHKINMQTSFSPIRFPTESNTFTLMNGNGRKDDSDQKYYDCSKSVLSAEECDLINNYHSDYMESINKLLSSSSKSNKIKSSSNSLKVNTSFFIR